MQRIESLSQHCELQHDSLLHDGRHSLNLLRLFSQNPFSQNLWPLLRTGASITLALAILGSSSFAHADTSGKKNLVVENEYVVRRLPAAPRTGPLAAPLQSESLPTLEVLQVRAVKNVDRINSGLAISDASSSLTKNAQPLVIAYDQSKDACAALKKNDSSIQLCSPNFVRTTFTPGSQDTGSQDTGTQNTGTQNTGPLQAASEVVPSDDRFNYQWPMQSFSGGSIRGSRAWQYSTGGPSPVVAIIDGGFNYLHPDLAENAWVNPGEIPNNGLDDDGNGFVDDVHGVDVTTGKGDPFSTDDHGSHVAGIIGARGNNGLGISGVNWNASLLGVKASGSDGYFTTKNLVKAIDYLIDLKIRRGIPIVAVNASLGGYNSSELELEGIRRLRDAGILFVAAAGNESVNIDRTPIYPANYHLDNIISVMASDRQGSRAGFSNYGFIEADIAAPGVDILSTISGDDYALMDGTSMAAPFVTGAISLLASSAPELTWKELRQKIFDTARPIPELERFTSTGRLLDLERMMADVAGVATLSEGAPSIPLIRSAAFSLVLASKKGRATKSLSLGSKFLIKAQREDALANPIQAPTTSTSYLEVGINRISCRRPVKIYGVSASSYSLIATAPSSSLVRELGITLLDGEGVVTAKRKLRLIGGPPTTKKVPQRTLEQICSRVIASLNFAQ